MPKFNPASSQKFHLILCFLLFSCFVYGQPQSEATGLLTPIASQRDHSETVSEADFFSIDKEALKNLLREDPESLIFPIPQKNRHDLVLELTQSEITVDDFKFSTSDESVRKSDIKEGLHFRGKIKGGSSEEWAAISLFENSLSGVVATSSGNLVLGKMQEVSRDGEDIYVLYNESNLLVPIDRNCDTELPPGYSDAYSSMSESTSLAGEKVVTVYYEVAHNVYTAFNSDVQDVLDYVYSVLNVVAIIYENENIDIRISEIYIWTTPDGKYTYSNNNNLYPFNEDKKDFNADLGHLLYSGGGGRAYRGVLCNSNYNTGCSGISGAVNSFPTYSVSADVVAHELGHNFGSPHTHKCAWGPNGNETIDNCAPPENGLCDPGPPPVNGGTIMSYCGVFPLSNGFGPEPGDLIRAKLAEAICIKDESYYHDCLIDTVVVLSECLPDATPQNVADDKYKVSFQVFGGGAKWILDFDGQLSTHDYEEVVTINNVSILGEEKKVNIYDATDNSCITTRRVSPPNECYKQYLCRDIDNISRVGDVSSQTLIEMVNTSDGGYLVLGNVLELENNIHLLKYSASGSLQWEKYFGGSSSDFPTDMIASADGGFIVAGFTTSVDGTFSNTGSNQSINCFAIKLNSNGDLLWSKTYGGQGIDRARAIAATPDGGFVLGGESNSDDGVFSSNLPSIHGVLVKCNSSGAVNWVKSYGVNNAKSDNILDVAVLANGSIIYTGNRGVEAYSQDRIWIGRVSPTGQEIWAKEYDSEAYCTGKDLAVNSQGQIILSAFIARSGPQISNYSEKDDVWIVKFDVNGNIIWESAYGRGGIQIGNDLEIGNGDRIYVAGSTTKDIHGALIGIIKRSWVLELDDSGELLWQRSVGGYSPGTTQAESILIRDNDQLLVGGTTTAAGGELPVGLNGPSDYFFINYSNNDCFPSTVCAINLTVNNVLCNNNGTPNNGADDTFTFEVAVSQNGNCSSAWNANGTSGTYGQSPTFGPFPISSGSQNITFTDSQNPGISKMVNVQAPAPCSGSNGADLKLEVSTSNNDPAQWNYFSVTYTLSNTGSLNGSGITVSIPALVGAVYQGGNEYTASVGSFDPSSGNWNVGVLNYGQTAAITLNYFNNSSNEKIAYAQVATSNAIDPDSTPGNGVPPNVNEDDEAAISINGSGQPNCSISASTSNIQCNNNGTPNNSNDDTFTFNLVVTGSNAGSQWIDGSTGLSGSYGATISAGPYAISSGNINLNIVPLNFTPPNACSATKTVFPPSTCSNGGGGAVDLELSASAPNLDPGQWTNYSVNFEVKNSGTQSVGNVKIHLPSPTGVVLTGGNEYSASQGSFSAFQSEEWSVGNLEANATATITLNYFNKTQDSKGHYGQVVSQNAADEDSTPNNGTPPTVNEDDEAILFINGGQPPNICNLSLSVDAINCNASGFADLIVQVTGTTASGNNNWTTSLPVNATGQLQTFTGTIGAIQNLSNIYIGPATLNITIVDQSDNNCSTSSSVSCPTGNLPDLYASNYSATSSANPGTVASFTFDLTNGGTAMANGDFNIKSYLSSNTTYSSNDVEVGLVPTGNVSVGTIPNIGGAISVPAGTAPGSYFLLLYVDSENDISESNENNNILSVPFTVNGGGTQGADLELNIDFSPANPGQWTYVDLVLTISNAGTEAVSNVKIDFAQQATNQTLTDRLAYVSHTAAVGTTYDGWLGIWDVGSLVAGESKVLNYRGFTKVSSPIHVFGQVASASPLDADSTPGNNSTEVPAEDDEALAVINANNSSQRLIDDGPATFKLFPNPASDRVSLDMERWLAGIANISVYDRLGRLRLVHKDLFVDHHVYEMAISDLEPGVYVVVVDVEGMRRSVQRLVVMR